MSIASQFGLVLTFVSAYREGLVYKCQSPAFRAPEVFQGHQFVQRSHVWACAAMVLWSIKPNIIGLQGNPSGDLSAEAWCIAKLMRLFPGWTGPPNPEDIPQLQFKYAQEFLEDGYPDLTGIDSLGKELQTTGILPELEDLLLYMLVPDPEQRPWPADVLNSDQFLALSRRLGFFSPVGHYKR